MRLKSKINLNRINYHGLLSIKNKAVSKKNFYIYGTLNDD